MQKTAGTDVDKCEHHVDSNTETMAKIVRHRYGQTAFQGNAALAAPTLSPLCQALGVHAAPSISLTISRRHFLVRLLERMSVRVCVCACQERDKDPTDGRR